eukprot:3142516-Alexandrium_andersonii.AAC.1
MANIVSALMSSDSWSIFIDRRLGPSGPGHCKLLHAWCVYHEPHVQSPGAITALEARRPGELEEDEGHNEAADLACGSLGDSGGRGGAD